MILAFGSVIFNGMGMPTVRRVEGKVALITGSARGQGRGHAIRLAAEGADVTAVDLCHDIDGVGCSLATPDDPKEIARFVE